MLMARGVAGERTLDDQVRPENTHGGDAYTGLGGTVCGTEAGEDDGGHAAHRSKERLSGVLAGDPAAAPVLCPHPPFWLFSVCAVVFAGEELVVC